MKNLEKTFAKGAFGTVAAGAMALAFASPAVAGDRYDRDLAATQTVAGSNIFSGVASVTTSFDRAERYDRRDRRYRDRYRDRRYDDRRYGRGYDDGYYGGGGYHAVNESEAVDTCVYATEREASRYFGGRRAQIINIDRVKRTRYGIQVQGRIDVPGLGYRRGSYDDARFHCYIDRNMDPAVNVAGHRLRG